MNQTDSPKAPVFIGPDVIVEGTIRRKDGGDQNEAAIITGVFKGNIDWPGIVHVAAGAEVVIDSKVSCREMDVAGTISGGGQNVVLETGMLRMRESATVDVGLLSLPPGGLEQERGAVVNANLRMTKEHPYASQQPQPAQSKPVLAVMSNEAPAAGGREQIPAFLTTGAQDGGAMQSWLPAPVSADFRTSRPRAARLQPVGGATWPLRFCCNRRGPARVDGEAGVR